MQQNQKVRRCVAGERSTFLKVLSILRVVRKERWETTRAVPIGREPIVMIYDQRGGLLACARANAE